MKKSLIALAAVAASGAAFAQSSVTLFGVADVAVTNVSGAEKWSGMAHSGNSSSRLGFRGVEDLGGGLKAQFWLEGAVNPDNGGAAGAGATSGFEFKRRSTVSLLGNFGELRLGRSTTAAYDAVSRYDVFGTVGVGQAQHWGDLVRGSNMVGFYSANYSGFKFGANYGFGEKAGDGRSSRYFGAGLTYDNGPLSLGLSVDRMNRVTNIDPAAMPATSPAEIAVKTAAEAAKKAAGDFYNNDMNRWSLGGSYNFGVAKLAAAYTDLQWKPAAGAKTKQRGYYIGVSAPVGAAGELKLSYNRYQERVQNQAKPKADQFALGYVHSLSKRTAVYGTYAHIKSKNGADMTLGGVNTGAKVKANGKMDAFQIGVRHNF